ncbi:MAG: glycerol-3-phosphate acyltransferase [Rickettsiales bacterium]|jgi:glycerol-3-phosphate acyltransferase PlsY|nr:glycerol-3-phosphate acyltransferase [Rickettsiales bacterium]
MVLAFKSFLAMGSYVTVSFLVAGIPFGYLIVRFVGNMDIRKHGSGNIGATNVWRVLGAKYAILTFLLDGLKSFLPVLLVRILSVKFPLGIFPHYFVSLVLLSTVASHIFSPWLGWHGGKGVSSFILGLLAMNPNIFLIVASSWLLAFSIFRISGLSAILSVLMAIVGSFFILDKVNFSLMLLIALLILWAHRKNLKELMSNAFGSGRTKK